MVDEESEPVNVHAYAGGSEAAPAIVSTRIERRIKKKTGVPFKFYEPNLS